MGFFGTFKKQLKKRIKLKRRLLTLGIWAALAAVVFSLAAYQWTAESGSGSADESFSLKKAAVSVFHSYTAPESPAAVTESAHVTVRRMYVCGEENVSLGEMTAARIHALAESHPDWVFEAKSADNVVFLAQVDDLSESCKKNSYIGIDGVGNLTLFDGPPKEERAVKTFFQLNIEHLESSLPEDVVRQLREGIRISDIAEYNSVLSTFSDFAVDETEKVMKSAP